MGEIKFGTDGWSKQFKYTISVQVKYLIHRQIPYRLLYIGAINTSLTFTI
jgi:hypothetical protein